MTQSSDGLREQIDAAIARRIADSDLMRRDEIPTYPLPEDMQARARVVAFAVGMVEKIPGGTVTGPGLGGYKESQNRTGDVLKLAAFIAGGEGKAA